MKLWNQIQMELLRHSEAKTDVFLVQRIQFCPFYRLHKIYLYNIEFCVWISSSECQPETIAFDRSIDTSGKKTKVNASLTRAGACNLFTFLRSSIRWPRINVKFMLPHFSYERCSQPLQIEWSPVCFYGTKTYAKTATKYSEPLMMHWLCEVNVHKW